MNIPPIPEGCPRLNTPRRARLCRWLLARFGWRFEGEFPAESRYIAIVAPHTSNWDFVLSMVVMYALELKLNFLAKHTLFKGPVGALFRYLGGIAVDRTAPQGLVGEVVRIFSGPEKLIIALTPTGTRSGDGTWKSGFYRMAEGAGVPIFPVAFDFGTKTVRFFPMLYPTGDADADIARLQGHFVGVKGKRD